MTPSIRRRLLKWLLAGLVLAVAGAGVLTYFVAREDVKDLFDYQLRQIALTQRYQKIMPSSGPQSSRLGGKRGDFLLQIWTRGGTLLYSSRPQLRFPRSKVPGFSDRIWQGGDWRLFMAEENGKIIQVAQPRSEWREMSAAIALSNVGPVLGLVPVLALFIWWAVGYGLRPLEEITEDLRRRSPTALTPLSVTGLPLEVRPLVEALNGLLGRLEQALTSQRRFVADAAHELRTPLAAVQLQVQLLERAGPEHERKEALAEVHRGLRRATHLVQQLLTMARIEPEAPEPLRGSVALGPLARTVVAGYAPLAQKKGIDLGLAQEEAVAVAGDRGELRILLGNLVDNALNYTPAPGRIDVRVASEGEQAVLVVEDSGPGIPPEDRGRVFDRFFRRPGSRQPGSGLGLAIVKGVAERHGGEVLLAAGEGGRGLQVTVRLPRLAEEASEQG